jgi:hypothetical protein
MNSTQAEACGCQLFIAPQSRACAGSFIFVLLRDEGYLPTEKYDTSTILGTIFYRVRIILVE